MENGKLYVLADSARSLWGTDAEIDGRAIALEAGARNVSVITLISP